MRTYDVYHSDGFSERAGWYFLDNDMGSNGPYVSKDYARIAASRHRLAGALGDPLPDLTKGLLADRTALDGHLAWITIFSGHVGALVCVGAGAFVTGGVLAMVALITTLSLWADRE